MNSSNIAIQNQDYADKCFADSMAHVLKSILKSSDIVYQSQYRSGNGDWVTEFVTYEKGTMSRYKSYGKTKEESENKEHAELVDEYKCDVSACAKRLLENRTKLRDE